MVSTIYKEVSIKSAFGIIFITGSPDIHTCKSLLIQIIIDKVISQRSLDTLQVLGIALVAVTIFEALLSSLRTFILTDTTNRIDMRLGAEVSHLLRLPVGFDKRPVGELGTG